MGTECFCSAAAGEVLLVVLVVLGIIKFLFKFRKICALEKSSCRYFSQLFGGCKAAQLRTVRNQIFRRLAEESCVASDEKVKDIGADKKHTHAKHITQHRRINQTDNSNTQGKLTSITHGKPFFFVIKRLNF